MTEGLSVTSVEHFDPDPPGSARALGSAPTAELTAQAVADKARELGFARVGFCGVEPFSRGQQVLQAWLRQGHQGEMRYLEAPARHEPLSLFPGARTLVVVALPYANHSGHRSLPLVRTTPPQEHAPPHSPDAKSASSILPKGRVARYAHGLDYHNVLKQRLRQLAQHTANLLDRRVLARPCVDTAPLLEHEAAARAGVGFTAKSTLTLSPGVGTFTLLGELLLDVDLPPSQPLTASCGRCEACLRACPTGAFLGAHVLDARRCISYLTIELSGSIPRALRPLIGQWVFGCDVCQEVCPHNHSPKRAASSLLGSSPDRAAPDLIHLLELTSGDHRRLVKDSAWRRVSRARLQRNAAVALGNSGAHAALEPLGRSLTSNSSPLVREHVAWAIGAIGGPAAVALLSDALDRELDPVVLAEISLSLQELEPHTAQPPAP